jgi:hypothetical protein
MRIRVPGRFIAASAILAAFLCLLPASSNIAVARPIGWEDVGPPDPDPKGDNDGVVLKSRTSSPSTTVYAAGSIGNVTTLKSGVRSVRVFYAVTKLDYWLFWLR